MTWPTVELTVPGPPTRQLGSRLASPRFNAGAVGRRSYFQRKGKKEKKEGKKRNYMYAQDSAFPVFVIDGRNRGKAHKKKDGKKRMAF